jgi:MYXO-CTERM domain-containing protein
VSNCNLLLKIFAFPFFFSAAPTTTSAAAEISVVVLAAAAGTAHACSIGEDRNNAAAAAMLLFFFETRRRRRSETGVVVRALSSPVVVPSVFTMAIDAGDGELMQLLPAALEAEEDASGLNVTRPCIATKQLSHRYSLSD